MWKPPFGTVCRGTRRTIHRCHFQSVRCTWTTGLVPVTISFQRTPTENNIISMQLSAYLWPHVFGGAHKPPRLLSLFRLGFATSLCFDRLGAVIGVGVAHMLTQASSFDPAAKCTSHGGRDKRSG